MNLLSKLNRIGGRIFMLAFVALTTCTMVQCGSNPSPAKTEELISAGVVVPDDTILIEFTGDEQRFMEDLNAVFASRREKICIKNHLIFSVQDFLCTDYGCFWLKSSKSRREDDYSTGKQDIYQFFTLEYYDLTDSQITAMKEEIDQVADEILAKIPTGADEWTTIKTIHDELCRMITYDTSLNLPHTHDLYGALVLRNAVCSAYSSAVHFLCTRIGFTTEASYSDNHAWNVIDVPSIERYVDVTWDDYDKTDKYGQPYICYDHFFLEFSEVREIDDHAFSGYEPYITYHGYLEDFNYYKHESCYARSYDRTEILGMFRRQYEEKSNCLRVRFQQGEDYQRALQWFENDCAELNEVLSELGYYEPYYYWYNDQLQTITIGLYADI